MKGIEIETNKENIHVMFTSDKVEYDVNELTAEKLKTIEEGALIAVLDRLQNYILNSIFVQMAIVKHMDEEINSACDYICDYEENILNIKRAVDKYVQIADRGAKHDIIKVLDLYVDEAVHSYREASELINKIVPIFTTATKVESFGIDDQTKERYLTIVTELNKKISKQLDVCNKFVKESSGNFIDNKEYFSALSEVFKEITKDMNIENLEKASNGESVNNQPKVQFIQKSQAEIEREFYINKANDLYNQLCLDWNRDFEKQTPFSVKDKYLKYMEKFNNFRDRFKMPLALNTSVGQAKEACNQINNLMNYISSVSNEAYTISSYNEK